MNKDLKFIGLVIVVGLLGITLKGKIPHEFFDSNKWKNWKESESEWSLRWDMMNSLRNRYELKGMTKYEIIDLLGKPESESKEEFHYYLGYSKRGINTGSLIIYFNDDNLVYKYYVFEG